LNSIGIWAGVEQIGVRPKDAVLLRESYRDVYHVFVGNRFIGPVGCKQLAEHTVAIDWNENKIVDLTQAEADDVQEN